MNIILKQDMPNLGNKDDIVAVKNGYARNYLIPKGYAINATEQAKKVHAEILRQRAHKEEQLKEAALLMAEELKKVSLIIGAKTSTKGKIFGSVNTIQIAEALIKEGFDFIFVMTISEPLSGTYQSAKLAKNMLDDPSIVHQFDSNMAAYGNERVLLRLMDYINDGLPVEEIITKVEHMFTTSRLVFTSLDLISLIKSGRLSKAKGLIGSLLRIKPVVKMEDGKLDMFHVARTAKKAIVLQMDYMKQDLKDGYDKLFVRVCNHNAMEPAAEIKEEIQAAFKDAIISVTNYIGPVFNVHLGPIGFGLTWHTE